MHLLLEPLLRLFAALVSRGGAPRIDRNQYGPVLVYPLRPGTAAFCLGSLLFAAWALSAAALALMHRDFVHLHPLRIAAALFVGPVALLLLLRTLSLDEEGLHRRSLLGHSTSIAWADLDHVERYQSRSAGKATFYIRSADGRTTLTVPEMTYNTAHLLEQIRRRVPLPERPRQKRHWWGG